MAFASRLVKTPFPPLLGDGGGRDGQSRMDVWCTQACPALSEAGFCGPVPDVLAQVHHVIVMTRAGRRMQPAALLRPPAVHRHCGIGLTAAAIVLRVVFLFARSVVLRERSGVNSTLHP
jgi:hypothetical protein